MTPRSSYADASPDAGAARLIRLEDARSATPRRDRRAPDAVCALSRRLDALCTSAVDPWEIAAGLEAEGMSDRECATYGYHDVFGLAEALFDLVPRRGARRRSRDGRAPITPARSILRGLIYALPGLVGIVALSQRDPAGVGVVLSAIALGWGWSQAWSFLGHRHLGWIGHQSAQAVLRAGLVAGLVVVPLVVAVLARTWGASAEAWASGTAVGVYMVGAGVLLVLGDDVALLAALLPGSIAGLLSLLEVAPWGRAGQLALAASSVLIVVGLAFWTTHQRTRGAHSTRLAWAGRPRRDEIRSAGPHFVYGVSCAAAVGLGPLTLELLRGGAVPALWNVALPVILSMGAAELVLERLMARTHGLLRITPGPGLFAHRAQAAFGAAVAAYLAVVVALSGLALVVGAGPPDTTAVVLVGGYAALAACFFVALVLVSIGRVVEATVAMCVGTATYLVLTALLPGSAAAIYTATFVALFLALLLVAMARLRSPLVHL